MPVQLGDDASHRAADARDELRGGDVVRILGRVGEHPPQVAIVEVRIVDAVVAPLVAVVLPQRDLQRRQRIDFLRIVDPRGGWSRSERISASMYSSFLSAFHPA